MGKDYTIIHVFPAHSEDDRSGREAPSRLNYFHFALVPLAMQPVFQSSEHRDGVPHIAVRTQREAQVGYRGRLHPWPLAEQITWNTVTCCVVLSDVPWGEVVYVQLCVSVCKGHAVYL